MGFSKQETLDLLAPRTEEEIELLLLELGFDIDEVDYPEDIVERVEKTFGVIDNAVKKLSASGANKSQSIVVKQATAITRKELADLNIAIPPESLMYLVQGAVVESQKAAALISEVAKTVFITEMHNQKQDFYQEVANSLHAGAKTMNKVFNDDTISKIVVDTVGETKEFDVDTFLAEQKQIRQETEKLKSRTSIKTVSQDEEFDVDDFLNNMKKKMEGK